MFIVNFIVPNKKNSYHPYFFKTRILALVAISLIIFNFLPVGLLPKSATYASNINASEIISLTNQQRANNGLGSLATNSQLNTAAKNKAEDMLAKDYWSHYGPNGETPWQFIKGAGYIYVYAGENLAKGFITSQSVVDAWMNSPSHKANILKGEYKDIGVYVVEGTLQGEQTILVVQMFGAKTTSSSGGNSSSGSNSSKAASSSKSSSSKPKVEGNIKITEPENGSFTNNDKVHIKGSTNLSGDVSFFNNDSLKGKSIAGNGAFDYVPEESFVEGENKVRGEIYDQNNAKNVVSNEVKFILDKRLPIIDDKNLVISDAENDKYQINFDVQDENIAEVYYLQGENKVSIEKKEGLYLFYTSKNEIQGITIYAKDAAGNIATNEITKEEIEGVINEDVNSAFQVTYTDNFPFNLKSIWDSLSFKQKINYGVILLILVIFLIDMVIVFSKNPIILRSRSIFSSVFLVIILLLSLIAGSGLIL